MASRISDGQAYAEYFLRGLVSAGYIRSWRVSRRPELEEIQLIVRLNNGDETRYQLTNHEIAMGGVEVLNQWLETISRDIRSREVRYDFGAYTVTTTCSMVGNVSVVDPAESEAAIARRVKAEKRAKDLFICAAGQEAFDRLERNLDVEIIGSKGTRYALFKRASYCIERVSDGAKFCAVVPAVPLYDHLLGIKLMVEHDEPKFLKTANKTGGITTRAAEQVVNESIWRRLRRLAA